jgi:hypothetical protein
MVFVEGDDYRALRRPGDDPAQFRSPVRLPRGRSVGLNDVVTNGLVLWYRFEDPSNTAIDATNELGVGADQTAFDGTVNGASFIQNGTFTDVLNGANSGAYDFDGLDDIITGVKAAPPQTTIICNVDVSTVNNFSRIYSSIPKNANGGYFIGLFDGGDRTLDVRVRDKNKNGLTVRDVVNITQLQQIGLSYDGTTLKLIKNGSIIGSGSTSVTPPQDKAAIGGRVNGNQNELAHDVIDDVRIYNRTLSASEFNQIYQNTDPDQ